MGSFQVGRSIVITAIRTLIKPSQPIGVLWKAYGKISECRWLVWFEGWMMSGFRV